MTSAQEKLLERAVEALEKIAAAMYSEDTGEGLADHVQFASYKLEGENGESVPDALARIARVTPG